MIPAPSKAPWRILFAGTPAFAVPSLEALLGMPRLEVVAVYTQPDRAAGRGRQFRPSAVKQFALRWDLPVEQPASWREESTLARVASWRADLLVVAAYGLILPAPGLALPRLGALNVHASLLPRWRGAAPIQRALMAGDPETGVTIMRVVPQLDAGPMLLARSCPIRDEDTAGTLEIRLAEIGAEALTAAIDALMQGPLEGTPQDETRATYAAKLAREDRALDWGRPALALARQIRALHPTPLASTDILGVPVSVLRAAALPTPGGARAGEVLAATAEGIDVACGEGVLRLLELQPQGKRPMSAREFLNGYRLHLNTVRSG